MSRCIVNTTAAGVSVTHVWTWAGSGEIPNGTPCDCGLTLRANGLAALREFAGAVPQAATHGAPLRDLTALVDAAIWEAKNAALGYDYGRDKLLAAIAQQGKELEADAHKWRAAYESELSKVMELGREAELMKMVRKSENASLSGLRDWMSRRYPMEAGRDCCEVAREMIERLDGPVSTTTHLPPGDAGRSSEDRGNSTAAGTRVSDRENAGPATHSTPDVTMDDLAALVDEAINALPGAHARSARSELLSALRQAVQARVTGGDAVQAGVGVPSPSESTDQLPMRPAAPTPETPPPFVPLCKNCGLTDDEHNATKGYCPDSPPGDDATGWEPDSPEWLRERLDDTRQRFSEAFIASSPLIDGDLRATPETVTEPHPASTEAHEADLLASMSEPEGTLPPIYFAVNDEVFQNRRGLRAVLIATAINDAQAARVCDALNRSSTSTGHEVPNGK